MSADRYVAMDGQIGKEPLNLGRAHFGWMPFAVEQDEPPHPPDIGLLSTIGVVLCA